MKNLLPVQSKYRWLLVVLLAWLAGPHAVRAGGPAPFMMETRLDGQMVEGQPLLWDSRSMLLMGRDGVYHIFPNAEAEESRKTRHGFLSYTSSEMQNRLRQEFGHGFDVSTTQHFVVVHPHGPWNAWADRMETLYRSFIRAMNVRGISTKEPQVSMVAVVFRNREEYFKHYTASSGAKPHPGTLGHYDAVSNRVFLYDDGHGTDNINTIIHEATHQTANNVGVHRRHTVQPRWLVEGLAMMFESPGMRSAWSLNTRKDRINRERLRDFQHGLKDRPKDTLLRLVAGDQSFRSNAVAAYAEAWTLTFFLYETHSREYSAYLARVAARPLMSTYSSQERVRDFVDAFGDNLELLDTHLQRFVSDL